jgi:hypothetical protein
MAVLREVVPCYSDRWLYSGKWYLVRNIFFRTALPAGQLLYWQQKGLFRILSIISGFTKWRGIETSGVVQFRIAGFILVDL